MLKIRLMRIGTKKRPFYRVVVVDERSKRTGGYIELLGTYNPLTEPKEIKLNQVQIDHWIKKGAQLSDGFLRIIGKAPQRPPRKPKKEKAVKETKVTNETVAEETPVEEAKSEPAEPTGAVESASDSGTSDDSVSQQTRSEDETKTTKVENTNPSGGERPDEPSTEEVSPEEK